jgi:hypothetical protein
MNQNIPNRLIPQHLKSDMIVTINPIISIDGSEFIDLVQRQQACDSNSNTKQGSKENQNRQKNIIA